METLLVIFKELANMLAYLIYWTSNVFNNNIFGKENTCKAENFVDMIYEKNG